MCGKLAQNFGEKHLKSSLFSINLTSFFACCIKTSDCKSLYYASKYSQENLISSDVSKYTKHSVILVLEAKKKAILGRQKIV